MRVMLSHVTRLDYSSDVVEGIMDVRLGPSSDAHQQWVRFELSTNPRATISRYVDGFGNAAHLISLRRRHRALEVVSRGEIETLLVDPFATPAQSPAPLSPSEHAENLLPSSLVPHDPDLAAMAEAFRPAAPEHTFDALQGLMQLVYREFAYEQRVTDVTTSVAEVVARRRGVCQDFAHVLIGLCRSIGIPARYVSGYIVNSARGSGASHAWVEAFTPTHGWRGFDATNNLVASTQHVKIATGRDYRDVSPTRGTYRGRAEQHLSVTVSAHPV